MLNVDLVIILGDTEGLEVTNDSGIHVVGSKLLTFSLMKFTASWEIMLGLQTGIRLDDGLNINRIQGKYMLENKKLSDCKRVYEFLRRILK